MDWLLFSFPEGRNKALTLSYDDGRQADRRLLELFNHHGLKGTFHLNAGKLGCAERIPAADIPVIYAGHEIATHGFTHPTLPRCPQAMQIEQILDDRKGLEALAGTLVRGHAYPNGRYTPELAALLPQLGIAYARTTRATHQYEMPEDWFNWHPTCHHNERLLEHGEAFLAQAKAHLFTVLSVWGHSWEFDRDDNWHLIETFCARISRHPEVWYTTQIELADYWQACLRVQFTARCDFAYNPNAIPVWLSLDGRIQKLAPGQGSALF